MLSIFGKEHLLMAIYITYIKCCLQKNYECQEELSDADIDDLCCIIQKLIPKAPQFSVLLKTQLMNAKSGDPQGWR